MWYLISKSDTRILYIVSSENDITIGRTADQQSVNLVIIDDASISRKHATLGTSDNNLYVQDLGSRYGTFINNAADRINLNCKIQLNHNDIIKFGKLNSVWTVKEVKHVTCTSTLKGENIHNLKTLLVKLGGTLKNEWDDSCTYLTMPAITLTIKVVLALAQGSHIVTTEYWNECLKSVKNNTHLPDPKNFTPQVIESTINKENVSFLSDHRRGQLFTGKKFVFFSRRQLEMYRMVLSKSSAVAMLLSESKMTKSMLCSPEVVVVQYNIASTSQESQAQKNQINDIVSYLNGKGRRAVADAEIGLAILYCSTEKYCNPTFNFTSEVFKQAPTPAKQTHILAPETQEEPQAVQCKKENVVINESLISQHDATTSNCSAKRKLSGDLLETNKNKKQATETSIPKQTNIDNSKRKFNDEEAQTNPTKKMAMGTGENNENEDFFNFVPTENTDKEKTTEKKLNFFKPVQKKAPVATNDEDDLFNFVSDKSKASANEQTSKVFNVTKDESRTEIDNKEVSNINNNSVNNQSDEELQSIMRDLDLGSTIIKVRKDLIVKKEIVEIENQSYKGVNFKKFKKVWPVKMQVTIIPKSSMSIVKSEAFDASDIISINMSDNE